MIIKQHDHNGFDDRGLAKFSLLPMIARSNLIFFFFFLIDGGDYDFFVCLSFCITTCELKSLTMSPGFLTLLS